jgi:uncharacterized protein
MNITGFIWMRHVVDKLAFKHHVTIYEVEEMFSRKPKFLFVEKGKRKKENVYMALGQTHAGRYLTAIFIYKPTTNEALILSARYGKKGEKILWQKITGKFYRILSHLMS